MFARTLGLGADQPCGAGTLASDPDDGGLPPGCNIAGTVGPSLEEHVARLEQAQSVGRIGSWELDLVTRVVTWSAELYRIHGLDGRADLCLYEHGLALVHPEDRDRVNVGVARAITERSPSAFEYRIVRPDGKVRHLQGRVQAKFADDAQPIGITGTAVDVSEFVAERALANARADFRTLVDHMAIGVVMNRGGRWIHVNRTFAAMLDYEPSDLVGRSPFEFLDASQHEEVRARIEQFASGDVQMPVRERRFRRRGGQQIVVEVIPRHLSDFEGAPAMLVLVRNVTDEKRLARQQLVAERMVSVGTLAAGVAHEINNPLAYVSSNLELLAKEIGSLHDQLPPGRARDLEALVADARSGAERVRRIVRGLRTLSHGDDEQRTHVDLHRVIDTALAIADNEIRHRARLSKEYGATPLVIADEGRLTQVFVNLLVNAAQAIREGNVEHNEIRVVTRTDGGHAIAEVHDTGPGIPEDVLHRLFDPFFTTKEVGAGTGLGLSICHGIITALGGRIEVETEVRKGTCFRVTLPLAVARLPETSGTRPASNQLPACRGRVLIVDDDPFVRRSFSRILRDHDMIEVETGRAALDVLRRDASFDVVLCDVMMPEMTGVDLYRELASSAPQLLERIVFITGGAFTSAARQFLDEVPNHRLEKPVDAQNLRATVEALVRLHVSIASKQQ